MTSTLEVGCCIECNVLQYQSLGGLLDILGCSCMFGVVLLERLTGTHIFSKVVAAFFVQVGRASWKGNLEGQVGRAKKNVL